MFEWYKRLDKSLKRRLDNMNLLKKYPDYFKSKLPFQIAAALILILSLSVWAIDGFNLAGVSISCPVSSPTPCHNPVYVCPPMDMLNFSYASGYFWHDGVRCNNIPNWICERVPCDKPYLQPGESYGDNDLLFTLALQADFLIILFAFFINHLLYMKRRGFKK